MTREDAKALMYRGMPYPVALEIVDMIYNDFESRTCENCKYNIFLHDRQVCELKCNGYMLGVDWEFCKYDPDDWRDLSNASIKVGYECNQWENK